ncbi:hypothetical protein GJV85_00975 [Sulfurimonas aquatica]|uniref:Uncharacterized protein n=1 Tax=Sulfurimonas aquatica TaxID=2672570 RepID=A0A975GC01_9BACT|nr:hypothetical protein [Sulfurimonas aquatica]QSZ40749.1 hypothetical protein GJV85_00975 [Sulfurimonas aquatica]
MWLNQLKIAIIEKNTDNLNRLLDNLPQLKDKKEIEEALFLLQAATDLVQGLKSETQASMIQMKKNITFLKATQEKPTSKFDIKS